jgi:VanZ family protein
MFSVLTVFVVNDFMGFGKAFFPRIRQIRNIYITTLVYVVLGGIAFGIAVEGLQHLMNLGRSAELMDIAYDFTGILIGLLYVWISRRFFPGRKPKD